jgi:DNA-binding XRE family transcriptional regulator
MRILKGKQFKKLRLQLELTQTQMASWFGVSDQTIARWEKGYPLSGSAAILAWLLYDEQINSNKNAIRDYLFPFRNP